MTKNVIIPANLDSDFTIDATKTKIRNNSVIVGAGLPTVTPPVLEKTWYYIDSISNRVSHYWTGTVWAIMVTNQTTIAQLKANPTSYPDVVYVSDKYKEGWFYYDAADVISADNVGTILVAVNGRRYKRHYEDSLNVRWFGATGQGLVDESPAIQATINYAKSLISDNGGTFRKQVFFPAGSYLLNTEINATDINGITLIGSGGKYINTTITGNTGGKMFDMTGSQQCVVENFTFVSGSGWPTPSRIGVQFALSKDPGTGIQRGGLNCSINNCYFQMDDINGVNGGLGSIGILNCRSEEFIINNCVISANCPVVFTQNKDMGVNTPYNFQISSNFAAVQDNVGGGSMGVINITGTSIIARSRRSPALILQGANAVDFVGYISRVGDVVVNMAGTNNVGIDIYNTTYNIDLGGTIESFDTIARFNSTYITNSTFDYTTANQFGTQIDVNGNYVAASIQPVFITNGQTTLISCVINTSFGNGINEVGIVRKFIESGSNGLNASLTRVINTVLNIPQWLDNRLVLQPDVRKESSNVTINTTQALSKESEFWVKKFSFPKFLTNFVSPIGGVNADIIRFDRLNNGVNGSNACFYTIVVEGTVSIGDHGTDVQALCAFEGHIVFVQNTNGTGSAIESTVIMKSFVSSDESKVKVTNMAVNLTTINSTIYGVNVALFGTGSGGAYPIYFSGQTKISTFSKNQESLLFD
jgi:hypothetical protein